MIEKNWTNFFLKWHWILIHAYEKMLGSLSAQAFHQSDNKIPIEALTSDKSIILKNGYGVVIQGKGICAENCSCPATTFISVTPESPKRPSTSAMMPIAARAAANTRDPILTSRQVMWSWKKWKDLLGDALFGSATLTLGVGSLTVNIPAKVNGSPFSVKTCCRS